MRISAFAGAASRRRVLSGVVAGVTRAAMAACAGTSTGGGTDNTAGQAKGPVSIDVLTRAGVTAQTGHSQWYANAAKTTFTPETNITLNLIDADPDVTTKLTGLGS